ncbi:MAG: pseudouridine synthase [Saprospiraceae bacterium]
MKSYKYYLFNKPFGVMSQFSKEQHDQKSLKDHLNVPVDVYPVGRLDKDSEGLLLLTNDPSVNSKILHPSNKLPKTYWVQIEGKPDKLKLQKLQSGVKIRIDGSLYLVKALTIRILEPDPVVPPRDPPIRFRKTVPDSWIEISIDEGKNRQVRRMLAAIGYPVLRLIRISIAKIQLLDLKPGTSKEILKSELIASLK